MPLFWLSLSFLVGIYLASLWPLSPGWWACFNLLLLSIILLPRLFRSRFTHPPRLIPWLLDRQLLRSGQRLVRRALDSIPEGILLPAALTPWLLVALFLGGARYFDAQPRIDESHIAWYNDRDTRMVVVGVVVEAPETRDNFIQVVIQAEEFREEDSIRHHPAAGLVLGRVPLDEDLHYGDRVALRGELRTPPEDEAFSYRAYLARQGVYSYMPYAQAGRLESGQGNLIMAGIFAFKHKALGLVYRFVPDPEASLMAGILLGVESGIDQDVQDAFRDTGTTHVIAISGFNITIVAGLFASLFGRWWGRVRGAVAAGVAIAVYTLLVGADAAVVRAAIMGGLALLARQVGRRGQGLNTMAVTAALMAVFNPLVLWDAGFQLSFAATLGLVLYAEPLSRRFETLALRRLPEDVVSRLVGPVGEYFLFTLAAQLTTFPVIIAQFQRFSLNSFPANIAILPAQPPVMIVGGLAVLIGMVSFPLGQVLAYLTWPFVAYTIRVVEWFAQFRGGVIVFGEVGSLFVAAYYLLLFGVTAWGKPIRNRVRSLSPPLVFAALLVTTSLTWQAALAAPDGQLHVTVLDVGTGDAVLIQTPGGRCVLIDGGPSASRLSDALGRRLPLFHRRLDYLIVAGAGDEQVGALPRLVERFPPAAVLWAGPRNVSRQARFLEDTITGLSIPIIEAQPGQALDLGQGARLEVLTVGNQGAILLLTWEDFRMLIPAGADFAGLETLGSGEEVGQVTVLLLADSGYAPVNPPEWIENLHPQVVLLSVAAGDYHGLPSAETLHLLEGYPLLRTDLNGWIGLTTDGKQFWVEVERGKQIAPLSTPPV